MKTITVNNGEIFTVIITDKNTPKKYNVKQKVAADIVAMKIPKDRNKKAIFEIEFRQFDQIL